MTEVDVIDDNFILTVEPPNDIFAEFVHHVATTEGWAFQLNDYEIWKNCYPRHWLFMVQETGSEKYVASISLAKSKLRDGSSLYTVAFFYCLVEYRNKGFGKLLFDKIQTIYGDHNCSLFGVGSMWKWYEKRYGFSHLQPYFHSAAVIQCKDLELQTSAQQFRIELANVRIEDIEENIDKLIKYDKKLCEMEREQVIKQWLMAPGVCSKIALNVDDDCVGFAAVREVSLNRLNISPLYADSPQIATKLLHTILSNFDFLPFHTISTVFPSVNSSVLELLRPFCDGKVTISEFCRSQFTQQLFTVDEMKIFGIRHCAHGYV
uniref:Acetyltransf_18 domain-containing protein n=1 Tax=Caenorhabditis japonica TaxID=281687 RepID=A0A8R1I4T4_CAEJA